MQAACPRLGMRAAAAVVAAGLLLSCPGAAGPLSAQVPTTAPLRIGGPLLGNVWDRETRKPISGVQLWLIPPDSMNNVLAESDAGGDFAFHPVAAGPYRLLVLALGYREFSDTLTLLAGEEAVTEVALVPEALELEPLLVRVAPGRSSLMRGFEQRKAMGAGTFVDRSEIEKRRPQQVTDLFRTMPGVRLVPDRRGDSHVTLRGQCRPALVMDGSPVFSGMSLDLILRPDDVEAIEVHSTASMPIEYARDGCGAVLIWTRVPEKVAGKGPWWRGLVVGAGVLALALVLK